MTKASDKTIKHRQVVEALAHIEGCRASAGVLSEPMGLLIIGKPGVGKSKVLNHYCKGFPPIRSKDGVQRSVVKMTIPPRAAIRPVQTALLRALGDPSPDQGTIARQGARLYVLLVACGVELIILDEAQHLYDRERSNRILQHVVDWLKCLMMETGIPVVLAGIPQAADILEHDRQIARRFASPYQMRPFSAQCEDSIREYRGFIAATETIWLGEGGDLSKGESFLRMHAATNGFQSEIVTLIAMARSIAQSAGMPSALTDSVLAQAFERYVGYSPERPTNPFTASVQALKRWPTFKNTILAH